MIVPFVGAWFFVPNLRILLPYQFWHIPKNSTHKQVYAVYVYVRKLSPNAIAIQIKNADAMPTVPEFSKVWDPMGNAILKSISGDEEPKNALNKAVYEIKDNE